MEATVSLMTECEACRGGDDDGVCAILARERLLLCRVRFAVYGERKTNSSLTEIIEMKMVISFCRYLIRKTTRPVLHPGRGG